MENKYFDSWEFQKAIDLSNSDPIEAKKLFENYLEKFPKDYSMYLYYSGCLMNLGDFNQAEKIINYIEKAINSDGQFASQKEKVDKIKDNLFYSKMRLLCLTERYKELDKFCLGKKAIIERLSLVSVLFYSQMKNKAFVKPKDEIYTYGFRQIIEYSEEEFKEHIKKHLADYNKDLLEPNNVVFSPDFPVNDVLKEIKKHIPSKSKIYSGFYENKYVFKYDSCGRDTNKVVDYFVLITFNNTADMITMYPSKECEKLPVIDLNYMKSKDNEPDVKIPSQIEKFNKRFKRK